MLLLLMKVQFSVEMGLTLLPYMRKIPILGPG